VCVGWKTTNLKSIKHGPSALLNSRDMHTADRLTWFPPVRYLAVACLSGSDTSSVVCNLVWVLGQYHRRALETSLETSLRAPDQCKAAGGGAPSRRRRKADAT
jgi:hypothetical protein